MKSALRSLVLKEFLELSRDRRVLIMGVVLPILMYPGLMYFTSRVEERQEEDLRSKVLTIALLGDLPGLRTALLDDDSLELRTDVDPDSLRSALRSKQIEAAVDAREGWAEPAATDLPTLRVWFHGSRVASQEARRRVERILDRLRDDEVERRYHDAGGQDDLFAVLPETRADVASAGAAAGADAGRMLVYILLWSIFSGGAAFATDLVAGEKERGTLETLFLLPVPRATVARAKLIVATAGTLLTGALNLLSLSLTYRMGWISSPGGTAALSWSAIGQTALLVLPLALLMASVLLAISSYSRSLKEAQYYILPVMLMMFIPAILSMSQTVELNLFVAMIPVANVAFAMRDAMLGQLQALPLLAVVLATCAYAALMMRWVASMLADEGKVLGFDPEPVFARSPAGRARALHLAMAVSLLVYFYVGQLLQSRYGFRGLVASLWLVLPVLALGVGNFARNHRSVADLLSLRAPSPRSLAAAVCFAVGVMWPIAGLLAGLQARVLPMPQADLEALADLLAEPSLWQLVLVGAFSPAVTEELLFRGVCLGLLLKLGRPRAALVFSALYFALMHLSVFRLAPTFVLGILMALLVWRSRSIFPAMLFHLIYNGGLLVGGTLHAEGRLSLPIEGPVVWALSLFLLLSGAFLLRAERGDGSTSGV